MDKVRGISKSSFKMSGPQANSQTKLEMSKARAMSQEEYSTNDPDVYGHSLKKGDSICVLSDMIHFTHHPDLSQCSARARSQEGRQPVLLFRSGPRDKKNQNVERFSNIYRLLIL